jgi:hypothetical protein
MRIALAVASLLLVAGGATACGDDDSSGGGGGGGDAADKGTSTEDFCAAFQGFSDDLEGVTGEEDNLGELLKNAAKKIEDAGTPDGIPDDAEEGLQLTLDAIDALPDDASAEDMAGLESDFSEDEKTKAEAFNTYLAKTCPDLGGASPSADASSAETPTAPTADPSTDG